jgi:hypothetical protein
MAVFELLELRPASALAPAIPALRVGPWKRAPPTIPAFSASAAAGPPESLWRVSLARDDDAHRAALAEGERSVAHTHAILDDLPRRLDDALTQALAALDPARARSVTPSPADAAQASRPAPVAPPPGSRDTPPARDHAPESQLIAALARPALPRRDALTAWSAAPGAPGAAQEPGWLAQTFERIADLARGRARIETHLAGALVAHSTMTLSGDTELWTAPRLSPAGARLHARTVAVAVRTRHAWARILTLVVRGCGQILVFGLPGGAAAIVPLVWRFVRGVLREVRDLQAALRPAG